MKWLIGCNPPSIPSPQPPSWPYTYPPRKPSLPSPSWPTPTRQYVQKIRKTCWQVEPWASYEKVVWQRLCFKFGGFMGCPGHPGFHASTSWSISVAILVGYAQTAAVGSVLLIQIRASMAFFCVFRFMNWINQFISSVNRLSIYFSAN